MYKTTTGPLTYVITDEEMSRPTSWAGGREHQTRIDYIKEEAHLFEDSKYWVDPTTTLLATSTMGGKVGVNLQVKGVAMEVAPFTWDIPDFVPGGLWLYTGVDQEIYLRAVFHSVDTYKIGHLRVTPHTNGLIEFVEPTPIMTFNASTPNGILARDSYWYLPQYNGKGLPVKAVFPDPDIPGDTTRLIIQSGGIKNKITHLELPNPKETHIEHGMLRVQQYRGDVKPGTGNIIGDAPTPLNVLDGFEVTPNCFTHPGAFPIVQAIEFTIPHTPSANQMVVAMDTAAGDMNAQGRILAWSKSNNTQPGVWESTLKYGPKGTLNTIVWDSNIPTAGTFRMEWDTTTGETTLKNGAWSQTAPGLPFEMNPAKRSSVAVSGDGTTLYSPSSMASWGSYQGPCEGITNPKAFDVNGNLISRITHDVGTSHRLTQFPIGKITKLVLKGVGPGKAVDPLTGCQGLLSIQLFVEDTPDFDGVTTGSALNALFNNSAYYLTFEGNDLKSGADPIFLDGTQDLEITFKPYLTIKCNGVEVFKNTGYNIARPILLGGLNPNTSTTWKGVEVYLEGVRVPDEELPGIWWGKTLTKVPIQLIPKGQDVFICPDNFSTVHSTGWVTLPNDSYQVFSSKIAHVLYSRLENKVMVQDWDGVDCEIPTPEGLELRCLIASPYMPEVLGMFGNPSGDDKVMVLHKTYLNPVEWDWIVPFNPPSWFDWSSVATPEGKFRCPTDGVFNGVTVMGNYEK